MPICILACITVVYVYFRRNTNHLFRKSVKRYSARFTLFLSARERAMDIIGYNYLKTMQNLHSENCLLAQHLSAKNLLANSADENFIRFWSLFPLNCITLRSSIFLLRREVVYHTTPYLSSHPPGQSELSVGNASAPHSYRSQAVCDFLWRIPSADTSLSERNSEMIGVYYQRLTHESLRIGSTNSINGSTFRTEMTGIILSEREVVSICQSVKCYFGNLTVVYFFNYRYRPTYSFRRERFSGGLIRRKKYLFQE